MLESRPVSWTHEQKLPYTAIHESSGEELYCSLPTTHSCLNTENPSTKDHWWLNFPTNKIGLGYINLNTETQEIWKQCNMTPPKVQLQSNTRNMKTM
jgi:hypothetical protein